MALCERTTKLVDDETNRRLSAIPMLAPMPLLRAALPFDDPDWIFELKWDGFRALAIIERGNVARESEWPYVQQVGWSEGVNC